MSYRPAGTLQVLRLLAGTTVRRLVRATKVHRQRRERDRRRDAPEADAGRRTATARKGGDGLVWLLVLMMPIWLYQGVVLAGNAVTRLRDAAQSFSEEGAQLVVPEPVTSAMVGDCTEHSLREVLDRLGIDELHRPRASRIVERWRRVGRAGFRQLRDDDSFWLVEAEPWAGPRTQHVFLCCGGILLLALQVLLLASGLSAANTELSGNGWQQAWLMTFPVSTRSLQLAHGLEYALVQFFPWFTYLPLCWQLLSATGVSYALPIAVLATLAATTFSGAMRLLLETWLRLRFSLQVLKTVQALCTITVLSMMALVFVGVLGKAVPTVFLAFADSMPAGLMVVLPGAWPAALHVYGWPAASCGVGVAATALALAVFGSARLLRDGVMRSGGVDAGRRGGSTWRSGAHAIGMFGKDLLLLRRDRNFLTQTLIAPVFAVGLQLLINPAFDVDGGRALRMLAFFLGIAGASAGCFQVLGGEGRALWMLTSLPVPIERVLAAKVRMWGAVGVAYAVLALLGFRMRGFDGDWAALLGEALLVAFGVWCSAWIAASVAVIGANVFADHVGRGLKIRHSYLFLFVAATFLGVLAAPSLGMRLGGAFAYGTLAFAFWQRARDRLRWLLDPVTETHDRLRLFDGGGALVVFLVLQVVVLLIQSRRALLEPTSLQILIAFAVAGFVAVGSWWRILARRGVPVAVALGMRPVAGGRFWCVAGLAIGALVGVGGLGYVHLVREYGWFELPSVEAKSVLPMVLLAVLCAPLCEELLFRGMIFGSLRRSVPTGVAVLWSSLLFAMVHPMAAWPPVFVVGALCALLYQRSGFLPAAMCVHAAYNAVVIGGAS